MKKISFKKVIVTIVAVILILVASDFIRLAFALFTVLLSSISLIIMCAVVAVIVGLLLYFIIKAVTKMTKFVKMIDL